MNCKTNLFTDKIKLLFWGIYCNNTKKEFDRYFIKI